MNDMEHASQHRHHVIRIVQQRRAFLSCVSTNFKADLLARLLGCISRRSLVAPTAAVTYISDRPVWPDKEWVSSAQRCAVSLLFS